MWNILRATSGLARAVSAALEAGHFRSHQADVNHEFIPGIFADFSQYFVEKLVRRVVNALLDSLQQAVLPEFLLGFPVYFEEAVREQKQHIVCLQRALANGILRLLEEAQCRAMAR